MSAHGEPLEPIVISPDGLHRFPDGTTGRPGSFTEAQQRKMDIFEALRLWTQTGNDSELVRLGIFSDGIT